MRIRPKVITDAIREPISLDEAKEILRITHTDHDALIEATITAARNHFEWATGRTLHQQTLEMYWNKFPAGSMPMELPRATPLISVEYLKYKDEDGTTYTWSSSEYVVDTASELGLIRPASGYSYPSTTLYPVSPIWARYTCGEASASPVTEIEEGIKRIIKALVVHWYENPDLVITEPGARAVVLPYGLGQAVAQYVIQPIF